VEFWRQCVSSTPAFLPFCVPTTAWGRRTAHSFQLLTYWANQTDGLSLNAATSGSIIRVSRNAIFNNTSGFTIGVGGTIASAGNNLTGLSNGGAPNAVAEQQ
jgi:hypothetical protein